MREILRTVEQEFVIGYGRGVNWTKSGVRFLIPLALRIDLCIIISLLRLPKRSAFSEWGYTHSMRNRLDPFNLLERNDKIGLAGGSASQYAPIFPQFSDVPGFWDASHFADVRLERLYALLLLKDDGTPLKLRLASRRWNPACLTHLYTIEGNPTLQVREERTISPHDSFTTRLTVTNRGSETASFHWLFWTTQIQQTLSDNITSLTIQEVTPEPDLIAYTHVTRYAGHSETPAQVKGWGERGNDNHKVGEAVLHVALGASRLSDSLCLLLAEPADLLPLWELSPASDHFIEGSLRDCPVTSPSDPLESEELRHLHIAQHYAIEVRPGETETLTFAATVSFTREDATENLRRDMASDPFRASRADWQKWFDAAPSFECSDAFLERAYWYRVFLLKFNSVQVGVSPLTHPCVFEGVGNFRSHVSYSSTAISRDAVFLNAELAKGCLLNLLEAQVANEDATGETDNDGFLPGHLYLARQDRGFYHADWGGAATHLYGVTGDLGFVRKVTPSLVRYAEFLDRERDRENSGLYDVTDQGETGQEYSPRYLFASPEADHWKPFRLKGIDATCYAVGLQQTLSQFSQLLGEREDATYWRERAEVTAQSVREAMWDAEQNFFVDVHSETGHRSPHKAAVGFYPLFFDIASHAQATALANHLEKGGIFATPYPVPTLSTDNPDFSASGDWHGVRTSCPWNGRVWQMTNAHVIAGFAKAGRRFGDSDLQSLAGNLFIRHIAMMFHNGDPTRPNSYEHYSPMTGRPAFFRGVDDYLHSWLISLIFEIVAGVLPESGTANRLVIDPTPLGLNHFRFEGIPLRGYRIDVIWSLSEGFVVNVDGKERVQLPYLQRVEIKL